MSDTNGQPDPDMRTEPLEGRPLPDQDSGVGAQERSADPVEEDERPRPSTDAETDEDTASGGPAD